MFIPRLSRSSRIHLIQIFFSRFREIQDCLFLYPKLFVQNWTNALFCQNPGIFSATRIILIFSNFQFHSTFIPNIWCLNASLGLNFHWDSSHPPLLALLETFQIGHYIYLNAVKLAEILQVWYHNAQINQGKARKAKEILENEPKMCFNSCMVFIVDCYTF